MSMEAKMAEWRRRVPSKRALTAQFDKFVQQKSVEVLYSPHEQERIRQMTEMITKATDEFETGEDWDRIIKVVDALSSISNRAVLKESVRFLRIRLADPSPRVVILALTLTESVVKNCGSLVHAEISTESFMNQMEMLYKIHSNKRGRDSLEITDRVLEMIQAWGEAFLPLRHQFPFFADRYQDMRKRGVKFPKQYDENRVPVLTPPPSNQSATADYAEDAQPAAATNTFAGLSGKEIYHVAVNVTEMFEDMIHEVEKDQSSIDSHGVIVELASQVRELVTRMEGVIQTAVVEDDDDIGKYLAVNDSLHSSLKAFNELSSRKSSQKQADAKAKATPTTDFFADEPAAASNQDDNDDDPFADFVRQRASSRHNVPVQSAPAKAAPVKKAPAPQDDNEEDPFASFVQERASKILVDNQKVEEETKPAPAPAKDLIDLWDDEPTPVSSAPSPVVADLWGDVITPMPIATEKATNQSPAQSPSLLDDDIWNGVASSSNIASNQNSISSTKSASVTNNNPFDILAGFEKVSVSPSPSANPFDSKPTASPAFNAPVAKSSNPFDF
ncbi:TPA: hypothetical protein N0F65_001342 [Lagenidium giganteum]|uniref:VHS domain-containing protein n=1 Tax=Lagenidium giganteum TaxID=4803 RepID=A0AAV2Z0H9_9STRA|nr:TPA: hypothetical protein N0F65_001342 [Lagenidium giganteum]